MRVTANSSQLQHALGLVMASVSEKVSVAAAAGVLLRATSDGVGQWLTLSGTDFDTSSTVRIPAVVEEAGLRLVPGKRLEEVVDRLPSGEVQVEAAGDHGVLMRAGRMRMELKGLLVVEYPALPEVDGPVVLTLAAGDVQRINGQVAVFARDIAGKRPALKGVCFRFGEKGLVRVVGTSGLWLAELWLEAGEGASGRKELLLAPDALAKAGKMFAGPKDTVQVRVDGGEGGNHVAFSGENRTFVSRMMGDDYPPYETMLAAAQAASQQAFRVDRDGLTEALRRVEVVAKSSPLHPVRLELAGGTLRLYSETSDAGQVAEELDVEREELVAGATAGAAVIYFNAEQLLSTLRGIEAPQVRVTFTHESMNTPALLYPYTPGAKKPEVSALPDPAYTLLLLPLNPGMYEGWAPVPEPGAAAEATPVATPKKRKAVAK